MGGRQPAAEKPSWETFAVPSRATALRWLLGIVVLGLGIWTLNTRVLGEHITECGFDANGPYAKVRINGLVGHLGSTSSKKVHVDFTYDGAWYLTTDGLETSEVDLPVLGTATTVVHGTYPPRVIDLHWVGGPKGKITVEGHEVVHRDDRFPFTLVPADFVAQHPHHRTVEEIVPDDLQRIGCSISPVDD